jgi:3-dehydroquinate synthetase
MRHDKKVREGEITFVLARGLGHAFIADGVAPADVLAVLEEAIAP